jgi:hypothetical protein
MGGEVCAGNEATTMTSVDGMDETLKDFVNEYRIARSRLIQWRMENFKNGDVVYVECPQYTGHAIVENNDDCPAEKLSVVLENENQWWYPLLMLCSASTRPGDWPNWIKRKKGMPL